MLKNILNKQIDEIKNSGLYKEERVITSPQRPKIEVQNNTSVLNFCSNNYLGLSSDQRLINASIEGIKKFGFGLSSVRFICGTQSIHRDLEKKVSHFLEKEDTILYSSCFDANTGLFETILNQDDAIISDELNHASIIDGVRLCKAHRFRYQNSNMKNLEEILKTTQKHRVRLITTDGVFSMDGFIAKLDQICVLAKKYNAVVHVDDSHATGFIGKNGKGTPEFHSVLDKVDIITSTFGKALGGASGGFTSASKEIITILRQKSRPYLFSNSLSPSIAHTSIKVLEIIEESSESRKQLINNTKYFREEIQKIGYTIKPGEHPIIPIMLGDAHLAKDISEDMLNQGIYVVGFSFPVVPKNQARIRIQISASHTQKHLDNLLDAFKKSGEKFNII